MGDDELDTADNTLVTGKTRRQFLKALGAGTLLGPLALLRWDAALTTGRRSVERPAVPAQVKNIPNSANSITSVEGGTRSDPEGVAPSGNVKLLTWKDSRNAGRTTTLGAYLYQYDFS